MKALSIKNPWAHLIAAGVKDVENRTWSTQHRGRMLIHASQKPDARYREMSLLFTPEQWAHLNGEVSDLCIVGRFPSSAIIGEVEVIGCVQNSDSVWAERFPGCWHWQLKNPILYQNPIINISGKLSLWEFDLASHGLAL